jgi:HEAT repeat protein
LIDALKSKNPGVRFEVVEALGALRDARAVSPLCEILRSPDSFERRHAVEALGLIGDPHPREALINLLTDPGSDEYMMMAAAEALAGVAIGSKSPGEDDGDAIVRLVDGINNQRTRLILAEVLLNSKRYLLETAARQWASSRGYRVYPGMPQYLSRTEAARPSRTQ